MRSVGRAIVLGLGVRVVRGVASGYAYTEELSEERMLEAARTAGAEGDNMPAAMRTLAAACAACEVTCDM